jgi:hypothetical protein
MHILTENEYQSHAEAVLRKIFANDDPFDQPFSASVEVRTILYRYDGYVEPPLINAVIAAAINLGDTGCYISLGPENVNYPTHCYIPIEEFLAGYAGFEGSDQLIGSQLGINVYGLETTIYSSSGTWGIMLSTARFALLGGATKFMEEINQLVPTLCEQVYDFLEELRYAKVTYPSEQVPLDWLPGLLTHVYGQEAAEKMLSERGLV